jgi:mediator of RNA polymerase II transcription subunit 5
MKLDLLEPFLLPSLVFALTWLGNYIWESSETDPTIPLKVLYALVKPNSISGEAEACHRTVLNITARTLEEQLKDVALALDVRSRDPRDPNRSSIKSIYDSDIKPILDILEPYLSFQCNGNSRRSELDSWTTHAEGVRGAIRNTFQGLVLWSASAEMSMSPHAYTHRLILAGIRLCTASDVLSILIDELKAQAEDASGSLDLALDVATTIVCAPMAESFAQELTIYHPIDPSKEAFPRVPILTLRDALMIQHQNVPKSSEKDPSRAEVIVRLTRRVNSLLTLPEHVGNLDVTNIIENINLEAAAAAAAGRDPMDLGDGAGAGTGTGDNGDGLGGPGAGGASNEPIDQLLNDVVAASANNDGSGGASDPHGLDTTGMDTSLDDILNAANMGNPEFLDLDMEGMF